MLTGGGAQLPGAVELAERILGMPVRLGVPRDVGGLSDTVDSPIFATGVGLVVYSARRHANLREEHERGTLKHGFKELFKRIFG